MNKTIRNVALRDSVNLITADYNGQDWYTDGYWATKYNVFEGYKVKKSQKISNNKPLLKTIIDNGNSYATATATEQELVIGDNCMTTLLETDNNSEKIQTIYYRLMLTLGADRFEVARNVHLNPVRAYKKNQLIGVVMPLRS